MLPLIGSSHKNIFTAKIVYRLIKCIVLRFSNIQVTSKKNYVLNFCQRIMRAYHPAVLVLQCRLIQLRSCIAYDDVMQIVAITATTVVITPPPLGERSIVMSVSVCLSVCLSVRDHILGTTRPIFTRFCAVNYGRGSILLRWRIVIRYVLPVLWMTSPWLTSQGCSKSPPS